MRVPSAGRLSVGDEGPVAVAGGGIAGLCAALAIVRTGRTVDLYEREPAPREEGAGLQLSPNASRHLAAWGVLEGLTASRPERVVVRRARDAAVLATMPLEDAAQRWGAPFLQAHRADLQSALHRAVAREPRIRSTFGAAVTGWRETPRFAVEQAGRVHDAAALVVADGTRSRLASRLGAGETLRAGRVAWRALVPSERAPAFAREAASNLWLGRDAHLVHYPLRGGTVVNVVVVFAGEAARTEDGTFWSHPGEASDVLARVATWAAAAQALVAAAPHWRVWPLLTRSAPKRLFAGRVALAGDAAHPMMPFLAQGAAQAIEDAAALGVAFGQHRNVGAALATYERLRLQRVRRVVAASERQATVYHLAGPAAAARDAVMRIGGATAMRAATDWLYRG